MLAILAGSRIPDASVVVWAFRLSRIALARSDNVRQLQGSIGAGRLKRSWRTRTGWERAEPFVSDYSWRLD
jgi:hypothetical protein